MKTIQLDFGFIKNCIAFNKHPSAGSRQNKAERDSPLNFFECVTLNGV